MKSFLTSLINVALAVATAAGVTGCALLEKHTSDVKKGSEGSVTAQAPVAANKNVKPLVPPKGSKASKGVSQAKKNKPAANAELSRRQSLEETNIEIPSDSKAEPATLRQTAPVAADFSINGEWTIFSVRNNQVTGEERPYINFDLAARRFYGSNGCNIINGDLKIGANSAIRMDNMITTQQLCEGAQFEYLINLAVSDVRSFAVRPDGSETYLDMKSGAGSTILVLRRHNMDFLNGAWTIETLNGTPLKEADDTNITINIPDLKIHGNTGCNIFNGELFIDPDKRRSMQFARISTTRMACAPDSRETELLLALEDVEHARLTGTDTVEMLGRDGTVLMTLRRLRLEQDR